VLAYTVTAPALLERVTVKFSMPAFSFTDAEFGEMVYVAAKVVAAKETATITSAIVEKPLRIRLVFIK
jgi:hypothetical protein